MFHYALKLGSPWGDGGTLPFLAKSLRKKLRRGQTGPDWSVSFPKRREQTAVHLGAEESGFLDSDESVGDSQGGELPVDLR
ncbi:hypothetical protein EYF80_016769 [Liparis tanakae]|uniref:Uncharacterized protein n=1 Tax=Liparis tanakae TaxID=230148 RepID=A0A4Z2I4I6_9TELE|nr:hypothetical protein EYF80_016769 [Liparis tanakae]